MTLRLGVIGAGAWAAFDDEDVRWSFDRVTDRIETVSLG